MDAIIARYWMNDLDKIGEILDSANTEYKITHRTNRKRRIFIYLLFFLSGLILGFTLCGYHIFLSTLG